MHYSVLLNESIRLLNINPDGIYIDGTFGRGGHSKAILSHLSQNGQLIAFDKDPEAIKYAGNSISDQRLNLIHDSFANLDSELDKLGIKQVNGILLDLGISSPQLDAPERGFSFRFDAPLDMRMNNQAGISASEWLNKATETELVDVFWRYGEEKFSRRIANAIVAARQKKLVTTTSQLANLISEQIPYREKGQHPATRVFQAIRIQVNNELSDLERILTIAPKYLKLNGRMVVISFHSLEDRIVKTHFASLAQANKLPKWVMVDDVQSEFKIIAKKMRASSGEIAENSRSRSAIMRCLERIHVKNN